jgi:hypothetical protein
MQFGHYISGFVHLGLLMGLFIGPDFQKDAEKVNYSNVSLISEQDFIDLTASNITPSVSEDASKLIPINENDDKLDFEFNEESKVVKSEGPEVVLDEPLEPEIKKPDLEPALKQRAPDISNELKLPDLEKVNKLPDVKNVKTKLKKPSKALKPNSMPQPEINLSQELKIAKGSVEELAVVKDNIDASTDIIISSPRPKSRPRQITKPNFESKSESEIIESAVSDASQSSVPQNTLSNPLTETETDNLQAAIQACWLRDPGSLAEDVKLTVFMSLDRNGRVNPSSIEVVEISGGDEDAQKVAFRRAKIAIISCGKNGYKLPPSKYERWKEIEVVFDPTN